jgi:hypothetical protein
MVTTIQNASVLRKVINMANGSVGRETTSSMAGLPHICMAHVVHRTPEGMYIYFGQS